MPLATRRAPGLARCAFALLGVLSLVATTAQAGDRESVVRLRAASLESEGRCEEAIELARQAHLDGIHDARIGLVGGRCQVRLLRYSQALATLDEAKALPPQLTEIDLYRGIALYHLEDYEAARQALDAAREELQGNALLDLYSGLLKLQRDEPREAALLLERARRADSSAVEPVASYYAFLAWRSIDEDTRAKAALERVKRIDPDGPWVAEAERIMTRRHAGSRSDYWVAIGAGMEYDTNVMVRGNRVPLPGDISDDSDGRAVWSIEGGAELLRTENWSGGLVAAYTGTAHIDLSEFNFHYPTAGAWIDREIGFDTTLRLRYDFGYSWVGKESFLETHDWPVSAHHRWEEAGRTSLAVVPLLRDYFYDPATLPPGGVTPEDVNRDGKGVEVDLEHRYGTGLGDLEVRGGYDYLHYSSEGQEYDFDAHEFMLGLYTSLPFEARARPALVIDLWGSFTYAPYENASLYRVTGDSNGPRKDHIWQVGAALERPVTDRVSLVCHYNFVDNGSNVTVYDYDRHIVGGSVQVKLW